MKITITPGENAVEVDGRHAFVDLSSLAAQVLKVQWFGQNGIVQAPPVNGEEGPVERITSLAPYQGFVDQALAIIAAEDAPPPVTLDALKHSARLMVDAEAGNARARFITVTPGQEMTYLEKVTQARALKIDDEEYGAEDYPLIFAEIGITAADAEGVADVILARYAAWQQIGAVIEGTRLSAKQAIDAADSAEAVAAIIDGLSWPQP